MPALQRLIADRYGGRDLPITLVLPDGARVALSQSPAVEVCARTFRGLRALTKPALGSLARAYVQGDIDFSGSARKVLGIAEAMVGAVDHGRERLSERVKTFLHQRRPNRATGHEPPVVGPSSLDGLMGPDWWDRRPAGLMPTDRRDAGPTCQPVPPVQ